MSKLNIIRRMLFALPLSEANFKLRGFEKDSPAQARLELVAKTVVSGYNTALETGLSDDLTTNTETIKKELVGFFNEGIGMGLYTLDVFSPFNRDRFWRFIKGKGKNHEYMSYIGAGIASGVFFNLPFEKFAEKADPTSGLLILNGLGFYYAYFKPKKTLKNMYMPKSVKKDPFYIECYDNGIGRALWFYNGGVPSSIAKTISNFPKERQGAIWSGVGLAATYAGGVSELKIKELQQLAGSLSHMLGEGSILACHTRDIAGNPHASDSTERILTGRSVKECNLFAAITKENLNGKRYINGKHSLLVFMENIREWVRENHETANVNSHHLQEVVR
ncbi:DUF1702 family protein [Ascidiimonas sp. W6]|uniref:DUF1702 family protein n=1 Tax=Ascidiimonas meishanensis TaxID=3128903 RepID=UPI0030EF0965